VDVANAAAGQRLRQRREALGFTLRHVEEASNSLARAFGNDEYILNLSRLSDIETKGVVPTIYRVHALSLIYHISIEEVLAFYEVDVNATTPVALPPPKKTTLFSFRRENAEVPLKLDPAFDLKKTSDIGRMIEKWGVVPIAMLSAALEKDYTYGYIGSEDFSMYPLLLPGSFVQVDESLSRVREGMWRSEYERPIYFIETRQGFHCCWCSVQGGTITLQPHPLSPAPVRVMQHPSEAEVIGQVVGVAMRLDFAPVSTSKELT